MTEATMPTVDQVEVRIGSTQPAGPRVSVVVPTHRRDDLLRRCLERVLAQDFPRDGYEIVVVDDAQSDTVPGVITAVEREHPDATIRLLPGASCGPATARNIGWRAASGAIIAFIDDDAYPENDEWLATGVARFADPHIDGVSGAVTVPSDDPPTDFQRNVKNLERGEFLTCNAFYRRAALERVGGFDERFTVPFREDSDLHYRVEESGGRLVIDPAVRVVHPAPRGPFGVSMRLQRYSMFNALMYRKHPERYRRDLQRYPPFLYYAIAACLVIVAVASVMRRWRLTWAASLGWLALEGWFFARRARGVSHEPRHLLDLALTSLVIPLLSIYWRLRGAIRFRVLFF
jgi:glycosyltransferase involved in cell wall biosynthesis